MQKWLMLVAGGVCGTVGRYVVSGLVSEWLGHEFPYGTLTVNTLGCLVIGLIASAAKHAVTLSHESQAFWMIGLLGAFTTFSTMIYDSWRLLQDGQSWIAMTNILIAVIFGFLAIWLGSELGGTLFR